MKKIVKIVICAFWGISRIAVADLYDIEDVPISAEMESAEMARTVAVGNGQKDAFWTLMNKMLTSDGLSEVSLPPEDTLQMMVQNISLSDEKTTNTKYMAMLHVRFRPDKIQAYLKENKIPFLMREMPKTIIIPVFLAEDKSHLLEESNPVYAFFQKQDNLTDYNMMLPMGDLEEVVQVRNIWASDSLEDLKLMADRYGVERVLLVRVEQKGPYLTIRTKSFPEFKALPDQVIDTVEPTGDIQRVMAYGWEKIVKEEETNWRKANTNDLSAPDELWVKIPINTLKEWVILRKKIEKKDVVDEINVKKFKPGEMTIAIKSKKTTDEINSRLNVEGFILTETDIRGLLELQKINRREGER